MNSSPLTSVETHFRSLTDPRAEHSIKHCLIDIVMQGDLCGNLS
ncbi:MAG: hypothetical protein ACRC2S_22295 [Waterburya sp.]